MRGDLYPSIYSTGMELFSGDNLCFTAVEIENLRPCSVDQRSLLEHWTL